VDRPLANPEEAPDADRFAVMPGFFETLRIGLLRGRFLDERDAQGAPRVVVVNRTLAEDLFADQDALGREVRLGPPTAQPRTIVGVVADTRHRGLHVPPVYQVYVPAPQWGGAESMMTLTVRTTGDPRQLAPAVREVARALDPAQPVTNVRAYEDVVAGSLGTERFAATLLAGFAAAALLLALVGLYGALGVVVRQREREIGVRMALGAAAAQVRAMVLRQGLGPVGAGLAAGLVLAAACARLLGSLLHGVSTWDPRTFAGAAALLAVSAVGAALLPAWRASRTDPAITLRSE
jgi:putative ABC transport system permease protein